MFAMAESREEWRLPFCVAPADRARGALRGCPMMGACVQAKDGPTHKDELRYAYDFLLPIGTPVLAARAGEVGAVTGLAGAAGGRGQGARQLCRASPRARPVHAVLSLGQSVRVRACGAARPGRRADRPLR